MSGDEVDVIREQWARLRPELDTGVIDTIGRVLRSAAIITRRADEFLAPFGLSRGEFDILAALRRSDEPQSPGSLRTISLATGPTTTKRLRSLESRGLVSRAPNPADGRGALIALTSAGGALADEVFPQMLALERALIDGVDETDVASVVDSLRTVLASVEAAPRHSP